VLFSVLLHAVNKQKLEAKTMLGNFI